MTVVESTGQFSDVQAAVCRIEGWLLRSGIQINEGAHRGGIVGWLDEDGKADFVYLEIAGYYLSTMAWLSSGAAGSPAHAHAADARARLAAGWVAAVLSTPKPPPTRLYLSGQRADWRNDAVFSFDLAMAAKGIAATRHVTGRLQRKRTLAALCTTMDRISSGAEMMASHERVAQSVTAMPDRWSTRPGPHHLKAAAAVLTLPERIAGRRLADMAHRTYAHWTSSLRDAPWPCLELHPLLYGLEGMLIRARTNGGDELAVVEELFARLMETQAPDGTLSETIHGGIVRSDVIAQALRIGMLLRSHQHLTGATWAERLDLLADALLAFVRPDGGVLFSHDQSISNTWCAMFAHQALYLHARQCARDPLPANTFELLV